jgi:hypothetical protein
MNKKNILKNKIYLLDYDAEDEIDVVTWIEKNNYYNCGCCDNCSCYDNIACNKCGCECNNDEYCDEIEYNTEEYETEKDNEDSTTNSQNKLNNNDSCNIISNISSFNINIINDKNKGKKVRITLQLNVNLSNNKKELITIEVDINKTTYLKIAQELFK